METDNLCGKKAYSSIGEASKALRALKRFSSRSHIPRRAYRCEQCGKYHLTSLARYSEWQ